MGRILSMGRILGATPIGSVYTMHECRTAKSAFWFKKVRDPPPKWIRVWVLGDENGARHTHFSSPV